MDEIIKFRAKATSEVAPNLWVHGYCFKRFEQDRLVAYISDGAIDVPAQEETICRYTGLKDKHGNEIYEHDILAFVFAGDCYIGEVIFEQGIYWFKTTSGENYCYDDVYDIEVMGNSFDNPELIKTKTYSHGKSDYRQPNSKRPHLCGTPEVLHRPGGRMRLHG